MTYQREVKEGDPVRITTQLLDYNHKLLHYFHRMYHAEEGFLSATNELLSVHVGFENRRSAPFPEALMDRFGRIHAAHAGLPPPPEAGRPMGIRHTPAGQRGPPPMPETPIDAAAPLAERPFDPDRAVGDCRHRLTDPGYGEGAYPGIPRLGGGLRPCRPGVERRPLARSPGDSTARNRGRSGVSARHDLLAPAHAGLPPARLYVGSWSEWSSDPDRPVATGEE